MNTLLERKDFSYEVLERDHFKCVICGATHDLTAHHIIDRSLFENGGYYLDNGVTVCPEDHLKAERTQISCKELRKKAGITNIILPEHFDTDEEWDHWGNIVMPTGARLRGELFFQDNVQKALSEGEVLGNFLPYVKYHRTYYLPWSPNLQNDDRMHKDIDFFIGKEIVCSIKMDGESTSMYPNYIHARSVDSKYHESRTLVQSLHGNIKHLIPDHFRICGENLYAKHSIHYRNLKSYFYVYSIWNEKNEALSWDDTVEYCELLNLITVPVFYRGLFNIETINKSFDSYCNSSPDPVEGYVIRLSTAIKYSNFKISFAKWVREEHVQTNKHWLKNKVIKNELMAQ